MDISPVNLGSDITIGMAAHGGHEVTLAALQCLFMAAYGDFELLLVDDASTDATLDAFQHAAREHKNTKIIRFAENREYVHSVNAILSHAAGNRVIFLSNDYLVTPGWFRQTIQTFQADPSVGIVTGLTSHCDNMNDPSRNLLNPGFEFNGPDELFFFAEGVATAFSERPLLDDPFLVGDAFVVSRAVLEKIGTFDTSFVGYMGDQDFGLRCERAGFRVVINQSAFAYHVRGGNIVHLDAQTREAKIKSRYIKVRTAFNHFVEKYKLQDVVGPQDDEGPVPAQAFLEAIAHAKKKVAPEQVFVDRVCYDTYFLVAPP
jgi:GT2 family glycosyltransferase